MPRKGKRMTSEVNRPQTSQRAQRPPRRVSDVVESGLWPDLPQREMEDLLGVDITLLDVRFLTSSQFDGNEYAVIKFKGDDGEEMTTLCGGRVVVTKLHELKAKSAFPILGAFTQVPGGAYGRYYDLL